MMNFVRVREIEKSHASTGVHTTKLRYYVQQNGGAGSPGVGGEKLIGSTISKLIPGMLCAPSSLKQIIAKFTKKTLPSNFTEGNEQHIKEHIRTYR